MDKNNNITFKIYNINNENNKNNKIKILLKEYNFDLKVKIIDIKNIILKELFNNEYNSLDFENINERVYKDFGKLFFDKGLLPSTIDNYKLGDFTNGDRIFEFIAYPKNIDVIKKNIVKEDCNSGVLKKIIMEERGTKEFVIYDDEFPPLTPIKK
jgi:hypothetical protein